MFELVTRQQHAFGDVSDHVRVPANPSLNRHQQTERTCAKCSLVKITVHPPQGGGWREWRWGDATWQFIDVVTPECVGESALQRDVDQGATEPADAPIGHPTAEVVSA